MRARLSLMLLVVFAMGVARPPEVHAWSPIAAAKRWIAGKAKKGAASLAEAASKPLARNLEASGKNLLADAEQAIARRMDQAEGATTRIIAETDRVVASNVDKIDRSVDARIVQVSVAANALLDHAFGRLDRSIGRIDAMARKRIDQIGVVAGKLAKDTIASASAEATKLLRQADEVLGKRIEDVRALVHTSIEEADAMAEARIAQLDELAGRRLGNIDVIATKQSLALEATVIHTAALVALVVFIAFVLWRLFVELSNAWTAAPDKQTRSRVVRTARHGGRRFLIQFALASAGAGVIWLLADHLPSGARERGAKQVVDHQDAFLAAVDTFDFPAVRYELAQLEVLRPAGLNDFRVLARKSALLERVFLRPASIESVQGMQWVMREAIELQGEKIVGEDDPDLLVLEAYVVWQTAETRRDEYEAAALCGHALTVGTGPTPTFHLAALAYNYLSAFLHVPYVSGDGEVKPQELEALRATFARATRPPEDPRFQHVIELDTIMATLDTASTKAYFEMLDAHADFANAAPGSPARADADTHRTEAAQRVVEAWRQFDAKLSTSPWLADDPVALDVFTLNDVVLSHALYFLTKPGLIDLPGAFLGAEETLTDAVVRVKAAPIRVAWAHRYAALLGPNAQDVLAFEETQRFAAFEADTRAFEKAYVELINRTRPGKPLPTKPEDVAKLAELAATAITSAASLALYRERDGKVVLEAAALAEHYTRATGAPPPPDTANKVADAYERRVVRFL